MAPYAAPVRIALVLVVPFLSSALAAQRALPVTVAGEAGRRLDAIVAEKAPGYWGAVLVAFEGRPLLAKGYGCADRAKAQNGPASLFDLGGAAQQLTAILALRLCAEKKLRLDDPVRKHLPDWPADKGAITIEHLLNHTSGLPPESTLGGGFGGGARPCAEAIGRAALVAAPGGTVRHTNLDGIVLALVAEQATQVRFDKLLADRVLRPFGMVGAGPCNGRFEARLVTTRRSDKDERGEPASAYPFDWTCRGARGVLASASDVHALLGSLLDGKLLDEAQLDLLWRPVAGGEQYTVAITGTGDERLLRIVGQVRGYRTRWLVHRASRSWVVLLTEDFGSTAELEAGLLAELAQQRATAASKAAEPAPAPAPGVAPAQPPLPPAPPAPAASGDPALLDRFVGSFQMPQGGGTLRIERSGDRLVLHGRGLQASVRVAGGAWTGRGEEALRRAEDRGLWIVDRLAHGDEPGAADGFAAGGPAAALQAVSAWLAAHGPLQRIEFVGSENGKPSHSWFAVHGAAGELLLRAAWHDDQRFAGCEVATGPPPFQAPVVVVRADWAVVRCAGGGELRLSIEGAGARRVLVFEDGTPGSGGLLDCPLLANGPR